jgi:hypothetical protein
VKFVSIPTEAIRNFVTQSLAKLSADTLGWLAAIALHSVTVPSLIALVTGLSDKTPSLDVVGLLYVGLGLLFLRAVVLKDILNIITIGAGFVMQATLMALVLFK